MTTSTTARKPAPRGRPTAYRVAFCDKVIALGKKGKSKTQIAATLGVSVTTLDTWCKEHPDFLGSMARAREAAMSWWEDQGQKGVWGNAKGFNSQAWSRSMAARFPEDYRERTETQITASLNISERAQQFREKAMAKLQEPKP